MSPFEDLQEEMTFIPTLTYSLLLFTTIFLMWDNADISLSPNQILTLMANNLPFCFYSKCALYLLLHRRYIRNCL